MLLKYSSFSVANVRINLNNQLCKDQLHKINTIRKIEVKLVHTQRAFEN